ncbi:MAG: hypothetical protein GQF41_3624 [Candidatus Rifleibacterium amylolyticum]|nr:MAG: hypothetical protein GQF41_3624 [Candidatus Rifleibacterium amylolyticum]
MASKKEWTWEYCGTWFGVKLSEDGNNLTWWASHVKDLKSGKKYVGKRSQSVESFKKKGPSYDNITIWELKNPDYIDNMYNPFYSEGEPDEIDGPRLHQIPQNIRIELCEYFGADMTRWPPPPDTTKGPPESPESVSEKDGHEEDAEFAISRIPDVPYKPALPGGKDLADLEALFKRFPRLANTIKSMSFSVYHFGTSIQNRFIEIAGAVLCPVLKSEADLRDLIAVLKDSRQALRQCGTMGLDVSSAVFWKFANAKLEYSDLLKVLFKNSPALESRFTANPRKGIRILLLDDEFLMMTVVEHSPIIEKLISTDDDLDSFVELMVRTAGNKNLNSDQMFQAMPKLCSILDLKTGKEVFDFLIGLIKRGIYMHGMNDPAWLHKLKQQHKGIQNKAVSLKILTRLKEFEDVFEYAKPYLSSDQNARKIEAAFRKMYGHYFGYSDLQADMEGMIPLVLKICVPLAKNLSDFLKLCGEVPRLVEDLPRDGESTPVGWTHIFDTKDLEARVRKSGSLDDILKA